MKSNLACKIRLAAVCFALGCAVGTAKSRVMGCKNGVKQRLGEKIELLKKSLGSVEDCLEKL